MRALTCGDQIPFVYHFCAKCDWDDLLEAQDNARNGPPPMDHDPEDDPAGRPRTMGRRSLPLLLLALAALALLLLAPFVAWAEDVPTPTPAPCDPSKAPCLTTESLALALRAWSPGATEPSDLAGGALQAELRFRRWRLQGQAIGTATAGSYKQGDWSTVRDLEAHLAAGYDALRLPGGIAIGPMVAIGGAAALPKDGIRARLARSNTLLIGAEGSWPSGRVHLGVGAAHPLDRGLSVVVKWQIPLAGRVYSMGYVAMGRRNVAATDGAPAHGEAAISAWTAVGMRL